MQYKIFGCKTNKYFTEKWMPLLENKEGYFISSCVVTDKAKAKWVKHALQVLSKLQAWEKLYLSGCGNIRNGVVDPRFFEIYHELLPYREKIELLPEDPDDTNSSTKIGEAGRGVRDTTHPLNPPILGGMIRTKLRSLKSIGKKQLFTRRYMVIQNGCDNFCTFCLTVQARGRHKWRPVDEIVDEINEFVENGGREVVFTGTNLGAWWADSSEDFKNSRFVELVETVLQKTSLERLRISSLGVEFCTDELIDLFKNPRIIAYAHLSIQSASSTILKSMNRHYDGEFLRQVLSKFQAIKREDGVILNIGADLIVGFPGETEDDFRQTIDIVRQFSITQLHAFAFSPHVDHYSVPAGSFPDQVPNHIAQRRLKELLHTGEIVLTNFLENNRGKEFKVLIEKIHQSGGWEGWTENYIKVDNTNFSLLPWEEVKRGKVVRGRLQK
jgi:MiaB/RimO family radical SAM methylthiotransferase